MSRKMDVSDIIKRHYQSSVKDAETNTVNFTDLFLFYIFPAIISVVFWLLGFYDRESLTTIYVTVCAIFAGLLLNLLILVYEQSRNNDRDIKVEEDKVKAPEAKENIELLMQENVETLENMNPVLYRRKQVLSELMDNISYSIVASVFAIAFCILAALSNGAELLLAVDSAGYLVDFDQTFLAISTFVILNLFMTLMMIVKRVHRLLDY